MGWFASFVGGLGCRIDGFVVMQPGQRADDHTAFPDPVERGQRPDPVLAGGNQHYAAGRRGAGAADHLHDLCAGAAVGH